uniref:Amino acid transporter transmembrane domain-containing protein n=1 Tax=Kalanchoe fedtschenkoi TaxID=63787 RepID=A0A7N0V310_KALFE
MSLPRHSSVMPIAAAAHNSINPDIDKNVDDDDRSDRTGTMWTASAHIITAVIGSGVLSLAWALAQLGWIAGIIVLLAFSIITYFTATLLADCHRAPVTGKRGRNYMEVVQANLGSTSVKLCGLAQYTTLVGVTIGYTITASISMVAVHRSNCFHKNGHNVSCQTADYPYMIAFGCVQIVLSQIPNFSELSWLSGVAAIMSFAYSTIGLGLSLAKVVEKGPKPKTSITGTTVGVGVSSVDKVGRVFQSIGNIAFAYSFSNILVEIQDTLKPNPPENTVMRKASFVGILTTTVFYSLCGVLGYAAFGNDAPGNFLTGFGFYEPFWLIDFANVCIAVHLVGAYQVYAQPIFGIVEEICSKKWPNSSFITEDHQVRLLGLVYPLNLFRLVWRTIYVILSAVLAMIFPFFNDILGLLGACSFYPMTVYFPVEMHIARAKIKRFSSTWVMLKILSWTCLAVSLVAAAGSIQGLVQSLKHYKPFGSVE